MSQLGFSTVIFKTTVFISAFLQLLLYLFSSLPYPLFLWFLHSELHPQNEVTKEQQGHGYSVTASFSACALPAARPAPGGNTRAPRRRQGRGPGRRRRRRNWTAAVWGCPTTSAAGAE